MTEIHKLTKNGETILPATTTDAVVHPELQTPLTSLINEYNVSTLFPTSGIDGTNKYDLQTAINLLDEKLAPEQKTVGIKVAFYTKTSESEFYQFSGDSFNSVDSWSQLVYAGEYIDNPEYLRVYVDSNNKFLWGIKIDGSIEWAKGIPTPIQEKFNELDSGDNNLTNRVIELENEVFPLSVSVSGGGTFELGTTQTITVTWTSKKGDEIITPDSQTINGETATSPKIYSGVTNTTTYTVSINYDGLIATGSTTATFLAPIYLGFAASSTPAELTITSLSLKQVKSSAAGTYNLNNPTDGYYLWICVPSDKSITRVTLNGFDVPLESPQSGSTTVGSYSCYRSSNQLVTGDYSFVVS